MPLQPGERLGPYAIESPVGAGGMGEVYRGRDTRLGRDVALKVISTAKAGDAGLRRRFEIESRAASALNHPSIVTVYDVGEANGIPWIAMEWVEGRTLRHALGAGPLPLRQAVQVALHVAEGLAAAHAKGIVHRDLKPANVMVTPEGRAKVLDFGLARLVAHGDDDELLSQAETLGSPGAEATRAGAILGTVGYMSPEQASGRPADARSDQFAFGLIVYEMLTGRRAFDHPTPVETLAAVVRDEPVPLSSLRPGIPPRLEAIVATCLAKSPDDRFASSRDLVAALEPLVASSASLDQPTQSDVDIVLPRPSRLRRGRLALVGLTAVALAAGIAGFRAYLAPEVVRSVAVLPFEEQSDNPASDYLGDGFSESLIDQLSQLPSLRVMARSTVFRFKGTSDPLGAARGLGVEAVVTGHVSRRAGQVSVSAELVDVQTGARIWSERFDRPFSDLVRLQDMLANGLVDGLGVRLSDDQKRALSRFGTRDAEAYDLVLQARQLFARETEEDDLEARQLLLKALERDPKFVEALMALNGTYVRAAAQGWMPPAIALAAARETASKAAAIEPQDVILRGTIAYQRLVSDWDWETAEREFRDISHDPRLLRGGQFRGWALYLWARGRPEEAAALLERALRVDPGNTETRVNRADYLAAAGRLDEAVAEYRAIVETEATFPSPLYGLAEALERKGDTPGAIAALGKAYELSADEDAAKALSSARTSSDLERVKAEVARAHLGELERLARERYVSPLDIARLQAQLGEREKAFESLDAALLERSPGLIFLKVDRAWDRIRDDPRFARIVGRVGIP